MKKKITFVLVLVLLCTACAVCFSGCKKVSSYEELIKGYNSGTIKLSQDIDCNYETFNPLLMGDNFDGNGFTIRNAVIKAEYNYASFFSESTKSIKNVTLENITVQGGGQCDAIVSAKSCKSITNVHVKDCKLNITQKVRDWRYACFAGGIYGGITDGTNNGSVKCVVTDCSVVNSELTLDEYAGSNLNQANIYMGGIAGCCAEISGCRVENCTISAASSDMSCTPYVGGIVGAISGNIENTSSVGNKITAKAMYYQDNIMHMYYTSDAYCGGIAAKVAPVAVSGFTEAPLGNISFCYSEDNEITAKCTGELCVGGLFGYVNQFGVNQCYAKGNTVVADGYKSGNKDNEIIRREGGLIGYSLNNSISNCFVYNDGGVFEYTFPPYASNSKAAGFIAVTKGVVINKCAVFNGEEAVNAPTQDGFCTAAPDSCESCYVSGELFGNVCGCETVDEDFWASPNTLKQKLGLASSYWKFDNGVPYLDFSE